MQVLSNAIYQSVEHRVIVNSNKDRVSLALFYNPRSDLLIEPFKQLVSDDRPAVYPPMTYEEYRLYVRTKGPCGKKQVESLKSPRPCSECWVDDCVPRWSLPLLKYVSNNIKQEFQGTSSRTSLNHLVQQFTTCFCFQGGIACLFWTCNGVPFLCCMIKMLELCYCVFACTKSWNKNQLFECLMELFLVGDVFFIINI